MTGQGRKAINLMRPLPLQFGHFICHCKLALTKCHRMKGLIFAKYVHQATQYNAYLIFVLLSFQAFPTTEQRQRVSHPCVFGELEFPLFIFALTHFSPAQWHATECTLFYVLISHNQSDRLPFARVRQEHFLQMATKNAKFYCSRYSDCCRTKIF